MDVLKQLRSNAPVSSGPLWFGRVVGMLQMALLGAACEPQPPPGDGPYGPIELFISAEGTASGSVEERASSGAVGESLPFEGSDERLASIAWRTWIYTDVGPQRTRYGYLRAGAVVPVKGPPIVNDGCAGGWYRVNPRGWVCLGRGATLDEQHPVAKASAVRPERGKGLPYLYALSGAKPPFLYFKPPSVAEMKSAEGAYQRHAITWWSARVARGEQEWLDVQPEVPPFLQELGVLTKPYGVAAPLRYAAHAGQAETDGGFAIQLAFRHEQRVFGLTTELDLIPLDRTRVVLPSEFRGIELQGPQGLPVAVIDRPWVTRYRRQINGTFHSEGALPKRTLVALTGQKVSDGSATFLETTDEYFVPAVAVRLVPPRERFPSVATGARKWIDISLRAQTLVAYEGKRAVYATLISSGAGGLGDPEKVPATIQGTFMIHSKHLTSTMNGEEDKTDSFNLRDVPFVQYFHKGFALHAAYWHDDFGRWRSHGCINLSPRDAAWLFEWTDPHLPEDWHGVLNPERGTVVHIHP